MPWKVKAFMHVTPRRVKYKTVLRSNECDASFERSLSYWVRNLEPGQKVVIRRSK